MDAINTIYQTRGMVPIDAARVWGQRADRSLHYVLAEDRGSGEVIATTLAA